MLHNAYLRAARSPLVLTCAARLTQCADVFFLKADICQLGLDQRKVRKEGGGAERGEEEVSACYGEPDALIANTWDID